MHLTIYKRQIWLLAGIWGGQAGTNFVSDLPGILVSSPNAAASIL